MEQQRNERVVLDVLLIIGRSVHVRFGIPGQEVRVEEGGDDRVQAFSELPPRLEHAQFSVDARIGFFDRAVILSLQRNQERE